MTSDVVGQAVAREGSSSGICLAVVATESFLPGALTTVGSFLQQHPGFGGDIVVIHDGLSRESRGYLEALSDRVRFEAVSGALRGRLELLPPSFHTFSGRQARLYTLEAFRLTGYRKVLLCDADLLFRQPIGDLLEAEGELVCCGDWARLRGLSRDPATFAFVDPHAEGALEGTFNSGFMLIDKCLIGERPYGDLLALVAPETWCRETPETTTDQLVLNRYFACRLTPTLVSWTYNYLLRHRARIRAREGLSWRGPRCCTSTCPRSRGCRRL